MERVVRSTEWAAKRAEERGDDEHVPKVELRSIPDALRCEHLIDREGTCAVKERSCKLHKTTNLLKCVVCKDHQLQPVSDDELLCLGLL